MIDSLPGFRDFYPEQLAVRRYIFDKWRTAGHLYGFNEYDGPPLESLDLYTQKSGQEIVSQLYTFIDKGDRPVALRPEMTPTLARMVGAHHRDYKKPIKWFAVPQLFRYERQQRGRLREHFQFNADIIGENNVGADAELIALAIDTLRSFGLTEKDFVVRISDRTAWQTFLTAVGVTEEQQYAAFQAIDKLEREPVEKTNGKLSALGLSENQITEIFNRAETESTQDAPELHQVMQLLGELRSYCKVDFKIVRGLAYYTGVVWEIHDRKGELRAIAGGGRYDNLLKQINGVDLPALGFGMGDVVLTELLKDRNLLPETNHHPDCYVVITDETLRENALTLIRSLRKHGVAVDFSLSPTKVNKQFQTASALRCNFALTIGAEEWKSGDVQLKNLATGSQHRVKVDAVANQIISGLEHRTLQTPQP